MAKHTKAQILDMAESLFAMNGYSQTSMRMITAKADVNLASVNYHFGSKKNLIQAVLKRYFDVLMPEIDKALAMTPAQAGFDGISALLDALVQPLLKLNAIKLNGTEIFVQLLGRGYNESQGHLRRFILADYGHTVRHLVHRLHQALPKVPASELFWRIHFAIGSFVFSMASSQALTDIAKADFNQEFAIADIIQQLIPFVARGIAGA
jgi:AcrR family transcriptional regulator